MITVVSREDRSKQELVFTVKIPFEKLITIDFSLTELELMNKANEGLLSPTKVAEVILMIAKKIERTENGKAEN